MLRHHALAASAVLLCLVLAQPAFAASGCKSLPGRAGLDQYCETIPGPTGDRSPGSGSGTGGHVSHSTARRLRASGTAGQALLGLVGRKSGGGGGTGNTGGNGGSAGNSHGRSSSKGGGKAGKEPSNNVLSAIRSSADSGASSGPGFVWILLVVAVLIGGLAWVRYRVRGRAS
jgi:hypothetical protein